jgi:hypothetical protein
LLINGGAGRDMKRPRQPFGVAIAIGEGQVQPKAAETDNSS